MSDDPFERFKASFDDVGERVDEYSTVWKSAIERNGRNEYRADDFMVDLQKLWGMSVRDVVSAGAAVVDLMAAVWERDSDAPSEPPPGSP
jgi:hypothetical protein